MNCPKCGAIPTNFAVKTKGAVYDAENCEYFRRCSCSKCGHIFYTIEYEVEYNDALQKKFDDANKIESSKKRFNDYRTLKKQVQKDKRRRVK